MQLFTKAITKKLLGNGRQAARDPGFDPYPVVKLFTPDAGATWLLGWLDPDEPDMAFGLCDLGHGFPELGWVPIVEFPQCRGPRGLPIERDRYFKPSKSLLRYADEARIAQCIVA